eukprot:scaffold363_cov331-Pavlova_lutheri.AAC.72
MATVDEQLSVPFVFGFGVGFSQDPFDEGARVHGVFERFPFHFHEHVPGELPVLGRFQLHHVLVVEGAIEPLLERASQELQQRVHALVPVQLLVEFGLGFFVPGGIFQVQIQVAWTILSDDLVVMPLLFGTRDVMRPKRIQGRRQERPTTVGAAFAREHAHGTVDRIHVREGVLLARKHHPFARRWRPTHARTQRIQPGSHQGVRAILARLLGPPGRFDAVETARIDAWKRKRDAWDARQAAAMRFAANRTCARRPGTLRRRLGARRIGTSLAILDASNRLPQAARLLPMARSALVAKGWRVRIGHARWHLSTWI